MIVGTNHNQNCTFIQCLSIINKNDWQFIIMSINIKQLEINVNLHALEPNFLNYELHYIIASNENTFRFATWDEEPEPGEKKYYCFLTEEELLIPAGDIRLEESYVLKDEPIYPVLSNASDFCKILSNLDTSTVAKGIRRFANEDIDVIKRGLEDTCGPVNKHVVTSSQAQHLLLVVGEVEISISATMVYFRHKAPFSDSHYQNVKEEQ